MSSPARPTTTRLAPATALRYVFGFRADVKDNVHYAEDGSVVYPAGHNVCLYSPEARTQRLIPGTLESEGITALCVSSNKKLLAVAERSDKAMITVYDLQTLKRRKVLVSTDAGSKVRGGAGGGACVCFSVHAVVLRAAEVRVALGLGGRRLQGARLTPTLLAGPSRVCACMRASVGWYGGWVGGRAITRGRGSMISSNMLGVVNTRGHNAPMQELSSLLQALLCAHALHAPHARGLQPKPQIPQTQDAAPSP